MLKLFHAVKAQPKTTGTVEMETPQVVHTYNSV